MCQVVHKAHLADKVARKTARQNFRMTNVAYLPHAAFESLPHQTRAEEADADADEPQGTAGGGAGGEACASELQQQQSQPVFPVAVSTAVLHLVDLLGDGGVGEESGQAVGTLASRIVHGCLVEDAALFLRCVFERITQRERQQSLVR